MHVMHSRLRYRHLLCAYVMLRLSGSMSFFQKTTELEALRDECNRLSEENMRISAEVQRLASENKPFEAVWDAARDSQCALEVYVCLRLHLCHSWQAPPLLAVALPIVRNKHPCTEIL